MEIREIVSRIGEWGVRKMTRSVEIRVTMGRKMVFYSKSGGKEDGSYLFISSSEIGRKRICMLNCGDNSNSSSLSYYCMIKVIPF